jgi:hypothetical protein
MAGATRKAGANRIAGATTAGATRTSMAASTFGCSPSSAFSLTSGLASSFFGFLPKKSSNSSKFESSLEGGFSVAGRWNRILPEALIFGVDKDHAEYE